MKTEKIEKRHWLLKTEPSAYSITDLKKDKKTLWSGVRNYQARNFMRDDMKVGDMCLFYHSGHETSIVGVAKITKVGIPDPTQFDKKDSHYDEKAKNESPTWFSPEIAFVKTFKRPVTLSEIKVNPKFNGMPLVQKGNRLSVQPLSKTHFDLIADLGSRL